VKVPKKIISVISSVQKHKKIPGFIYNLPEDLREEIIQSQKKAIVIDAFEVNTKYFIVNAVYKALGLPSGAGFGVTTTMLHIENMIGDRIVIIDRIEYLAPNAYQQVKEFMKSKIPVLLLSSHEGFGERFRGTKFYRENNLFDCDFNDIN
jgi:hypothetical protein